MADPTLSPPLSRPSIIAAHELIKPFIHHTPTLSNSTLTLLASTPRDPGDLKGTEWEGRTPARPKLRLWFKCENLQKVGAFKARGAFHALGRLIQEPGWEEGGGRGRGVVTHSSGTYFHLSVFFFLCAWCVSTSNGDGRRSTKRKCGEWWKRGATFAYNGRWMKVVWSGGLNILTTITLGILYGWYAAC
jgi:hypothetical protein